MDHAVGWCEIFVMGAVLVVRGATGAVLTVLGGLLVVGALGNIILSIDLPSHKINNWLYYRMMRFSKQSNAINRRTFP